MGGRGAPSGLTGANAPQAAPAPAPQPQPTSPAPVTPQQAASTPASLTAAQTHDEIRQYMQSKYHIQVDPGLDRKIDTDALRTACAGVEAVIAEFPGVARYIRTIQGGARGQAIAAVNPRGEIFLNTRMWKTQQSIDGIAQQNLQSKFHPQGTGAAEFTSHEAGHMLNLMLINAAVRKADAARVAQGATPWTKTQRRMASAADWNTNRTATDVIDRAVAAIGASAQQAGLTPPSKAKLRSAVSGYAKQNDAETLAECVADYVKNRGQARRLSREVWRILKQEIQ